MKKIILSAITVLTVTLSLSSCSSMLSPYSVYGANGGVVYPTRNTGLPGVHPFGTALPRVPAQVDVVNTQRVVTVGLGGY